MSLEAFRLPLSAIAEAELVVVVGDDPVVERAPIVDLWIKEARRRGAEIVVCSPAGAVQTPPGGAPSSLPRAGDAGRRARRTVAKGAERAVLIWSGPGGGGGARIAELAHELGFEGKPGSGAFHLPVTPNGRGAAAAWAAASDGEETKSESIGVLVVSGDEAAADPAVRALAEQADRVLVITMFHELAGGWADLILPATASLERDGTTMNLEGRLQRLRRAANATLPGRARLDLQAREPFRRRRLAACVTRVRRALRASLQRSHTRRSRPARTPPGKASVGRA